MDSYLRFQTRIRCGDTGRPLGVFVSAGRVKDSSRTPEATRERLCESLSWFNQNLPVPSSDDCHWRCIFWFRAEATRLIQRIWDLIAVLDEEGVFVQKIWTNEPGMIKYCDPYQIAAIPHRQSKALRV